MDLLYSQRLLVSVLILLECSHEEAESFDYFTLAFQWPNTFCKTQQCGGNWNYWTIHGFWPSNKTPPNPRNCNNTFDETEIKSLEGQLNKIWPNLKKNGKNEGFWKDQWFKHGSCATSVQCVNNVLKYFDKVKTLATVYNVTKILLNGNIIENKKYKIKTIQSAIQKETKMRSDITFSSKNCLKYLSEVRICLSKEFVVKDCPNQKSSSEEVFYPGTKNLKELHSNTKCPRVNHSNNNKVTVVGVTTFFVFLLIVVVVVLYAHFKKCKAKRHYRSYENIPL